MKKTNLVFAALAMVGTAYAVDVPSSVMRTDVDQQMKTETLEQPTQDELTGVNPLDQNSAVINKGEEMKVKGQEKAADMKAKAEEKAADMKAKAEEKAADMKAKAEEKAGEMKTKAEEKADELKDKAAKKAQELKDKMDKHHDKMMEKKKEHIKSGY